MTIMANGPIAAGDFTQARVDGPSPSEIIKIQGIQSSFVRSKLKVGNKHLRQIRTGLHAGPEGSELHVVFDLTSSNVAVLRIEPQGSKLVAHVHTPQRD